MIRPGRASLLVFVLVLVAAVCFGEAWRTAHQPRRLAPAASLSLEHVPSGARTTSPPPFGPANTTTSSAGNQPSSPPQRVDIPAVGMSVHVVPIGLASDGSVAIPPPTVAGWYTAGPAPGELGPAVLVGHVDSRVGPAVFYPLIRARVGDRITISRADGSVVQFAISAITEVRKSVFPTAAVFAPTDGTSLRLITCSGAFDTTQGHYVDSLIVWANATR